jgi:hypothetical protein
MMCPAAVAGATVCRHQDQASERSTLSQLFSEAENGNHLSYTD